MSIHLKSGIAASVLCAALIVPAPSVEAGGVFGMHIGTGGFGVSVGVGDWSTYTASWTNPQFSLDYNAALSGYGEWVWVADLGRVWRPWVSVGWRPYTYGRWVFTSLGWTWVAYEPWGYVPHHFGSWAMCDFGWVWVPGYTYVSANVVWVRSGGYVGWYARPPRGWSHTARSYSRGYRDGYHDGWRDARYATYVDWNHMGSENVSHYAVRHAVAARGRVQDHAAPPTAEEVRRRGGISVTETRLSQRTVTMNGRRVSVARPEGVARSIELHASETAAAALSPRALERRQPSVRPLPSTQSATSGARGEALGISSTRSLPSGNGIQIPGQSTRRDSAAMTGRRVDEPTGRGAVATGVRLSRSPGSSGSLRVSPGVSGQRSAASSRSSGSYESVDRQRDEVSRSRSAVRPGSSAPTAGNSNQRPSRREPVAGRTMIRSESASRDTAPRDTVSQAATRRTAVRARPARSSSTDVESSGRSSNIRRRQAATHSRSSADPDVKSTRQSTARRRR